MLEQYIKDEGSSPSMLKRAVVGHFPLVEIPIAPTASSFIGIKSLLSKEIASSFSNKSYLYVKKRNRNYSKKLQIIEKNLAKVEIDGKYVNIEDVRENLKIFNEHIERLSKRFNQQAGYIVCALFASAWASMFASNPPWLKVEICCFL